MDEYVGVQLRHGQEQVTTKALEALIEQQRVTKEQTNKANDLLTELNAKKMEMEVLKMNLQKQEQDISKKVERIKELEQGQDAKRNELKTKVEGLENQINWMDAKIKFHEGQEEKIQKELSDKKAEVERLEERNAKVTEQWMEKSQKICEAMKLKDKEIAQVHREMGEVTEKENEIEKVKKHITIWHNNIQSLLESSNKIETIEADGLVGLQAAEEWKHSALSSLRTQLNEKELQINEKESKIKEQDGQIKQLKTERDSLNSECQAYKFATQTVGNYASATTDIASAHNKAMDILTKNTRKQLTIENNQTGGNNLAVVPISSPSIPPDLHHEVVKAESSSFSD
ncbi:myosin heavy chain, clone 203-like isoform X2 [Dysidea avara]|uniref:myosin heavy chain, clone 203-like isoform X2 n=1 Tax=Dysidea avara TaxID=196820 RepID=UPI003329923B